MPRLRRFCYARYLNRELCYPLHHLYLEMPSYFTAYLALAHYDRHRIYMSDIFNTTCGVALNLLHICATPSVFVAASSISTPSTPRTR